MTETVRLKELKCLIPSNYPRAIKSLGVIKAQAPNMATKNNVRNGREQWGSVKETPGAHMQ